MKCLKVERVNNNSDLYDLEIDGGNWNYIAEGIVVHNTNVQIGIVPMSEAAKQFHCGRFYVTSKGLGGRGVILDYADKGNVYVSQAEAEALFVKLACFRQEHKDVFGDEPVRIIGEIFGPGIQAGFNYGSDKVQFRMFDISYGDRYNKKFVDFDLLEKIANDYHIPLVPVLYRGPFNEEVLSKYTDGKETVSGKAIHIREGIVVKTVKERETIGQRASFKSVSEKYLLRKGEQTEYN